MILSFMGGFAAATLGTLWLCMVWIPSIQFSPIVKIIFLILMVPFMCCLAALGGLSKAVEAGAGSATGILNELKDMASEKPNDKKK